MNCLYNSLTRGMKSLAPLSLILMFVALGDAPMAADSDLVGTWKLNVPESRFVSERFKAGTITIDEGLPTAADGDPSLPRGIRWTQEFVKEDGKYEAREWAGTLDGKVTAYQSRQPGTMSIRRRDARTLDLSILPAGGPAIVATCSLTPDGNRLIVTTRTSEQSGATDSWILDRSFPTTTDVTVLQRADELLRDPYFWDRSVGRQCPADARKFSLFCALQRAQIESTGLYEHRAPCMQVVRKVVDERVKDRNYEHRLDGYNNDPTTSFNDIKLVLRTSIERITNQLKQSR